MRDFLKASSRRVRAGWFWPLVLLALPNCASILGVEDWNPNGKGGSNPPPVFQPGSTDLSGAVMCDIPDITDPTFDACAVTDTDVMNSMRMAEAAVALVQGYNNIQVIDYSQSAFNTCGGPKKTLFFNAFPDGTRLCLNCGTQMPVPYLTGDEACFAKCIDLVQFSPQFDGDPDGAENFCSTNAHVSTNFDKEHCYTGACDASGSPNLDFHDPRRDQEDVIWIPQNGATASGNNLGRTAGRSGNFDVGGFSQQCVQHGDAWVEFQVSDANGGYAVGFSQTPNLHETLDDVPFALVLNENSTLAIQEFGVPVAENLGTYAPGQRFRVKVIENNDGSNTATLSAVRLDCPQPSTCVETKLGSSSSTSPNYKLWVDASLMDQGPILGSVTMVSIQRDLSADPTNCDIP